MYLFPKRVHVTSTTIVSCHILIRTEIFLQSFPEEIIFLRLRYYFATSGSRVSVAFSFFDPLTPIENLQKMTI